MMKKLILLSISFMLFFNIINGQITNLLTQATSISASGGTNPSFPISKLYDVDITSKWQSNIQGYVYLNITLAYPIRFMTVKLQNVSATDGFSIELSVDGATYNSVASYNTSAGTFIKSNLFYCINNEFKAYKFIRLKLGGNQGCASIGNFEITEDAPILWKFETSNLSSPLNIFDNNSNTKSSRENSGSQYLNIYLKENIQAANVVIKTGSKGYIVDLYNGSTCIQKAYYYTSGVADENFYIICPESFNRINFTASESSIDFYEFDLSKIALNAASLSYNYDDAGQMTTRTIMLNTSLAEEITQQDTIIPMETVLDPEQKPIEDKFGEASILIYPNPTKGKLRMVPVGIGADKMCELQLYNTNGHLIFNKRFHTEEFEIDLTGKPNGTYLITITIDGETKQWTIIKK